MMRLLRESAFLFLTTVFATFATYAYRASAPTPPGPVPSVVVDIPAQLSGPSYQELILLMAQVRALKIDGEIFAEIIPNSPLRCDATGMISYSFSRARDGLFELSIVSPGSGGDVGPCTSSRVNVTDMTYSGDNKALLAGEILSSRLDMVLTPATYFSRVTLLNGANLLVPYRGGFMDWAKVVYDIKDASGLKFVENAALMGMDTFSEMVIAVSATANATVIADVVDLTISASDDSTVYVEMVSSMLTARGAGNADMTVVVASPDVTVNSNVQQNAQLNIVYYSPPPPFPGDDVVEQQQQQH